jgi:hypothetical protein
LTISVRRERIAHFQIELKPGDVDSLENTLRAMDDLLKDFLDKVENLPGLKKTGMNEG